MPNPSDFIAHNDTLDPSLLASSPLEASLGALELPWIGLIAALVVLFALLLPMGLYRKVEQGHALIINKTDRVDVSFTGGLVVPVIHRAEIMDLSVKTIEISRSGREGLLCKDDIRANIKATFFVRVNPTADDVLQVAQTIGTARASHPQTLEQLFHAKFSEALQTVGKRLEFEELYTRRHDFKQQIVEIIGEELNGYALDDAVIDHLEQTPMTAMDPRNVLDARGIRKISSITASEAIETHGLRCDERLELHRTDVAAREAILVLDQRRASAEARKARKVASVWAREQAQTVQALAEQRRKAALARIDQEREITFGNGKRKRLTALAQLGRTRVVQKEQQRLLREQQLMQVDRERQAGLVTLAQSKAVEHEQKNIAHVVRARVMLDQAVAKQQERIVDLQVIAAARRAKEARCLAAEAQADSVLIEQVEHARARAEAAEHTARALITRAEAALVASDAQSQAKGRRAKGTRAALAASGLARVNVRTAAAAALEAQGRARAQATVARMNAEAKGRQTIGLAQVRVKEAKAESIVATGLARAEARRERLLAKAVGTERQGLALASVKQSDASATAAMGRARGAALRKRMLAEAHGLEGRIDALNGHDSQSREHEKLRYMADKMVEVWRDLDRIDVGQLSAGLNSVTASADS